MKMRGLTALAVAMVCALMPALPSASSHGLFEASELEVHLLNDEGSDVIESYGGYDITELFIVFAHDGAVAPGAAGDGLAFRIELYGLMEKGPQIPNQKWTVQISAKTSTGTLTRTISTQDGKTFTSDFESLLVQIDQKEHATHIQRAFVSFAKAGLAPGDALSQIKVESRANGDLRDISPGGIPVPGTNGVATYPEPTAIPGKGRLVESINLRAPDRYVKLAVQAQTDGSFQVNVRSALTKGGQHVFVQPTAVAGWTYELTGETSKPLAANGTLSFTLHAARGNATAPLQLDIVTDVGGRTGLTLGNDMVLHGPDGILATAPLPAPAHSPAVGLLIGVGLLVAAALRRKA